MAADDWDIYLCLIQLKNSDWGYITHIAESMILWARSEAEAKGESIECESIQKLREEGFNIIGIRASKVEESFYNWKFRENEEEEEE